LSTRAAPNSRLPNNDRSLYSLLTQFGEVAGTPGRPLAIVVRTQIRTQTSGISVRIRQRLLKYEIGI
jgi:hypothetical protein